MTGGQGHHGEKREEQVEGREVSEPKMPPPRQRLFVLHFVQADARANGFGLGIGETVRPRVQTSEQRVCFVLGGRGQLLR